MLQIVSQVNILNKCQLKSKVLSLYTNLLKKSMRLLYIYILKQKVLEN